MLFYSSRLRKRRKGSFKSTGLYDIVINSTSETNTRNGTTVVRFNHDVIQSSDLCETADMINLKTKSWSWCQNHDKVMRHVVVKSGFILTT